MNNFTYVIIDDDYNNVLKTKQIADSFQNLTFLASATNYDDAIDCILEHNPSFIFLEIDPSDKESNLSLHIINELHRYLSVVPKVFVTTKNDALSLQAFKYGVFDYLLFPIEIKELRKSIFRLEKEIGVNHSTVKTSHINPNNTLVSQSTLAPNTTSNSENINEIFQEINTIVDIPEVINVVNQDIEDEVEQENESKEVITELDNETLSETVRAIENNEVTFIQSDNQKEKPLIICVKSYGDYRYIDAKDICYLQADNNSTDIHLNTGEMITAFKTLKHFEGVLKYPFVRIHNSYILNIEYVSRIHTGNAVCHIKNTTTKLPFSKSYKENIDAIISTIASGNYIEI
ncbi:LytTR family DNA-binding domain-containing protein [Flavobacterium sp.]|uniref:LytR/AlgR family response regulator transcription factor n=1 Tax=Flavobacterium sp. TaxID=239 RepID=UPI00260417E8|nr:LytTR family DNA-binding domain-containing protein [Flavobacterium sp.]